MSPFTTCESGHDLTKPDAYIYLPTRDRKCRTCHQSSLPKSKQPKVVKEKDAARGVFNP